MIRVLVWWLGPLGPGRVQPIWHLLIMKISTGRVDMKQVHTHGNLPFDCFAGITVRPQVAGWMDPVRRLDHSLWPCRGAVQAGWSGGKKHFCCLHFDKGC